MPTCQFAVSAAGTAPVLLAYVPPGPCTATFSVTSGTAYLGGNSSSNLTATGVPVTSTAPYTITHGAPSAQLPVYGAVSSGTVTVTYTFSTSLSG